MKEVCVLLMNGFSSRILVALSKKFGLFWDWGFLHLLSMFDTSWLTLQIMNTSLRAHSDPVSI